MRFGTLAAMACLGMHGTYFSPEDTGGGVAPAPAAAAVPKTYSQSEYDSLVAERAALTAERTTLTAERDSVKTKLTAYEQSQLSEQQKAEGKAAEAEQKREAADARAKAAQDRVVKAEFKVAAKEAGIVDADLALLAIQSKIEYSEDGEPKNIAALLEQLVKDKPFLVSLPGASIGLTPGAARSGNGGVPTTEDRINADFAKTRGSANGFRIG